MTTPASIYDDMAAGDPSLAHLLLEQLQDFRKESRENLKEVKDDLRDDIDGIKSDVAEVKSDVGDVATKIEDVQDQLSGKGGVNERLTKLEMQVTKSHKTQPTSDSSSPPAAKKSVINKETAITAGAGVGVSGILYLVLEIVKSFMATK